MAADKKKPLDSLLLPLPHSLSSPLFSPPPPIYPVPAYTQAYCRTTKSGQISELGKNQRLRQ